MLAMHKWPCTNGDKKPRNINAKSRVVEKNRENTNVLHVLIYICTLISCLTIFRLDLAPT